MRSILCFGGSNTWGYIPGSEFARFEYAERWPGIMQQQLGDDFLVIENGLSGRTTVWDDPTFPDRCGRLQLQPVLYLRPRTRVEGLDAPRICRCGDHGVMRGAV